MQKKKNKQTQNPPPKPPQKQASIIKQKSKQGLKRRIVEWQKK